MNDSADLLAGLDPDRLLALSLRPSPRHDRALSTVLAALVDDDAAWTREVPVRHVAAICAVVVASLDRAGLLA